MKRFNDDAGVKAGVDVNVNQSRKPARKSSTSPYTFLALFTTHRLLDYQVSFAPSNLGMQPQSCKEPQLAVQSTSCVSYLSYIRDVPTESQQ